PRAAPGPRSPLPWPPGVAMPGSIPAASRSPGTRAGPSGGAFGGKRIRDGVGLLFAGVKRPDLSVVVVHHRGQEHLLEALDALAASARGPEFETILVDNTAGRPMEEVLRRHPGIRRIAAAGNVGFAAGCRLGAEAARAPLLAFVNDDAAVEPGALAFLASALSSAAADVTAAAGRLVDVSGEKNDFSDGFLTFDGHAF